jgi:hypothetical protein
MSQDAMLYVAASVAAVAVPETQKMLLKMTAREGDLDFTATLPARDVGPLIVELASELRKMPVDPSGDVMPTMMLTGVQPTWTEDYRPVLLLQLNGHVDVAVEIEPGDLDKLRRAVERLCAGPKHAAQKPQ